MRSPPWLSSGCSRRFGLVCGRVDFAAGKLHEESAKNAVDGGTRRNPSPGRSGIRLHCWPPYNMGGNKQVSTCNNSPHALLSPLEISLGLPCNFESFGEVGADAFQASLGEGLQLQEFLLFCVQLPGSAFCVMSARHFQTCLGTVSRRRNLMSQHNLGLHRGGLTLAPALPVPCPTVLGQRCLACGHSECRRRQLRKAIRSWIHNRR